MGILARMHAGPPREVIDRVVTILRPAASAARSVGASHAFQQRRCALFVGTIAVLQVGYLLGGILCVETIFNWPRPGQG